jgi:hypothetical protein
MIDDHVCCGKLCRSKTGARHPSRSGYGLAPGTPAVLESRTSAFFIAPLKPRLWGISRIRADSNFIQYFRKASPVRRTNEIIAEKIGGTQNFDVIVNSGKRRWGDNF